VKLQPHWKPLLKAFETDVSNRADDIDPEQQHDWLGLTVGWAIAKGLAPGDANDFAIYVRYETGLA